jgi:hypothetical protein
MLADRIRLARPAAAAYTAELDARHRCADAIKAADRDLRWLPPQRATAIADAAKAARDELARLPPLDRERRTAGEDAVDELTGRRERASRRSVGRPRARSPSPR